MKEQLSHKFDHLPQDFDREAIWEGIETPTRWSVVRNYVRLTLVAIISAGLILVFVRSDDPVAKAGTSDLARTAEPAAGKGYAAPEAKVPAPKSEAAPESVSLFSGPSDRSPKSTVAQVKNSDMAEGGLVVEPVEQVDRRHLKSPPPDRTINEYREENIEHGIEPLPALPFALQSISKKPLSGIRHIEVVKRPKPGRHSLTFQAGLGTHGFRFSATEEEGAMWRRELEKPQLDYGLGLRYEYRMRHHVLLSLSAAYRLYKEKIIFSHIRESGGEAVRMDYKLHNHYHVFSGQAEVGKRFYQKHFFWDALAGLGVKFFQVSEVDYFVGEGELATAEQINRAYPNTPDLYFTAQAALGKHLSDRLFFRMGAQVHSRMDLTTQEADTRHRILPVQAFLEVGMRF